MKNNIKIIIFSKIFLIFFLIIFVILFSKCIGIFEPNIVYAEGHGAEISTTTTPLVKLENYISVDTASKFIKNDLYPVTTQDKLHISENSNNGKTDLTYLSILGCEYEYYNIFPDAWFKDLTSYAEKDLKLVEAYVGDTEAFNMLQYQYHKHLLKQAHMELPESLKNNTDGFQKILSTNEIFTDNIEKLHKHVHLVYEGPAREIYYRQHAITTSPLTKHKLAGLYYGTNISNDYIHACNSPIIELVPKERDSYVQIMPREIYLDKCELLKYQHHFTQQITDFNGILNSIRNNPTEKPDETQVIRFFKNSLKKNPDLKKLLVILKLIPSNLNELTMTHIIQLCSLSDVTIQNLIHDILTNIPKTKLTSEAEPIFKSIIDQLPNHKFSPPLYNQIFSNIQLNSVPKNYAINTNSMLYFKSSNYSFLMKTIARIQQLM